MLEVSFDVQDLVHCEFIPEGRTVNKEMCVEIRCLLKDAVKKETSGKRARNSRILLHDNASAYRSLVVKKCLVKSNLMALEHPLKCPDLPSPFFFLFLLTKKHSEWKQFASAQEVTIKPTRAVIKVSKNGFQERFQKLYERQKKCVTARGKHFQGNLV
jgi:hypothetical protein